MSRNTSKLRWRKVLGDSMKTQKHSKKLTKKKQKKVKQQDTSSKVLLVIFLILCVVVFILATIMITKNASNNKEKYDIKVPLTEEELSSGIDIKINMDDVEKNKSKEYRIKVTNYLEAKVNNDIIHYQMKITKSSKKDKVDVELYSNKDNFELLEGKNKITNLSIGKEKKETITYTLKLTQRKEPTKKQYINVKITKMK